MSVAAGAPRPRSVGHARRPQAVTRSGRRATRPSRSQRLLRISTVVVTALALVSLFGLVGFHALIVRDQTRIDRIDASIAELEAQREELLLAVAQLEAPERIRAEAIGRLGMIEPETVVYLDPVAPEVLGTSLFDDIGREAEGDAADAAEDGAAADGVEGDATDEVDE